MKRLLVTIVLTIAVLSTALPASAVSLADGMLYINGYGNWYYAKSDGNFYLADDDGDWDNAEVTLSFIGRPSDRVTVHIQPFWEVSEEGVETEVDMAFAEYGFSDAFNLRLGIARHPFGVYTPIYDAGTLRPFMTLPTGLYTEGAGIIAESYTGIGLHGLFGLSTAWGLEYDIYGGALNISSTQPWEAAEGDMMMEEEEGEEEEEVIELEDLIGGKVVVHTPVDGLSFGGSIYTGTVTGEVESGRLEDEQSLSWGLQAEYWTDKVTFRAEYANQDIEEESKVDAAYVEAAYMVTRNLQLAARWDWQETSLQGVEEEEFADVDSSLLEHTEWSLGANWWFSPNFVVKLSYHIVDGLRFAVPEESDGEDEADEKTNTVVLGASFSF